MQRGENTMFKYKSHRLISLLSLLMILSLLAACAQQPAAPAATQAPAAATQAAGAPAAASGNVIKVATQSPLSGDQSAIGVDIKNGAELAVDQLKGPIEAMGFKVQLAPYDDQANPDIGVNNAKQIVADPTILCVDGHYNSGVQIPSSEVYHTANLANVSPANTN